MSWREYEAKEEGERQQKNFSCISNARESGAVPDLRFLWHIFFSRVYVFVFSFHTLFGWW